jgi:hypothetical protein
MVIYMYLNINIINLYVLYAITYILPQGRKEREGVLRPIPTSIKCDYTKTATCN